MAHTATPTGATTAQTIRETVREMIDYDDARASAPQEHAITTLASVGFAWCALRAPSRATAVLHAMVAGALLYRAASGRDGVRRWVGAPAARPERAARVQPAATNDWRSSGPMASDPQASSPQGL